MEEYKDVVEGRFEFVRQYPEFDIIAHHGKHVLLHHDKAFSGQP